MIDILKWKRIWAYLSVFFGKHVVYIKRDKPCYAEKRQPHLKVNTTYTVWHHHSHEFHLLRAHFKWLRRIWEHKRTQSCQLENVSHVLAWNSDPFLIINVFWLMAVFSTTNARQIVLRWIIFAWCHYFTVKLQSFCYAKTIQPSKRNGWVNSSQSNIFHLVWWKGAHFVVSSV